VDSVYAAAGGAEGLLNLASSWHRRVIADEVVSHAFSHGYHPQHTERLAAYWSDALGGPASYSRLYRDETSVVRIHSGNGPHEDMDRRAIEFFDRALEDAGLASDAKLQKVPHDYFAWATDHHDVPLPPLGRRGARRPAHPHWSWNGLVEGTGPDDL